MPLFPGDLSLIAFTNTDPALAHSKRIWTVLRKKTRTDPPSPGLERVRTMTDVMENHRLSHRSVRFSAIGKFSFCFVTQWHTRKQAKPLLWGPLNICMSSDPDNHNLTSTPHIDQLSIKMTDCKSDYFIYISVSQKYQYYGAKSILKYWKPVTGWWAPAFKHSYEISIYNVCLQHSIADIAFSLFSVALTKD